MTWLLVASSQNFTVHFSFSSFNLSWFLDTTALIYKHPEGHVLVIAFECLQEWDCSLFAVRYLECQAAVTVLSMPGFQLVLSWDFSGKLAR